MNKTFKTKLFSLFLIIITICSLSLVACSNNPTQPKDDRGEPTGTAYLNVSFPEDANLKDIENIENAEIPLYSEETTALDVLKEYCDSNKISVIIENGTYTYVKSIGGLQENDLGTGTGWVFEINEEMVMEGASAYNVKDGESVLWKFVNFTDMDM